MADWENVRAIAMALPEVEERSEGDLDWRVRGKLFAWERPLRRGDLAALGAMAPTGPILAARVPDVGAKEALVADPEGPYFTTPHFDGYPAILVRLRAIALDDLRDLLVEAWLSRAPKRVAAAYLDGREFPRSSP